MNPHEVRTLVRLLSVNLLALWAMALIGSGLFYTPRLPLLARILLVAGAVVFTVTTGYLWRRARRLAGR